MVDYYILEHLILGPAVDTEVVLEEHNLVEPYLVEAFLALEYHIVEAFLELELGIDLVVVFPEPLEHFEERTPEEPYLVEAFLEEHNLVEVVEAYSD
jgi:hypothetical protein